jgi:hypothetical protein
MSIPQFVVFSPKVHNEFQGVIIDRLTKAGYPPLVDSVHITQDWAGWFKEQFVLLDHRVFYNLPGFSSGFMEDIDIAVLGIPHVIMYFTGPRTNELSWGLLDKWMNKILNNVDLMNCDYLELEKTIRLPTTATLLSSPKEAQEDPLVQSTSANDFYYTFECKHIVDFDKVLVSIRKPDHKKPFTLIINDYQKNGYLPLFTDLFTSPDWGSVLDANFLKSLWGELGYTEEFDLQERLRKRTAEFLPNDTAEALSEPVVHRMYIEDILQGSSFGRIFY